MEDEEETQLGGFFRPRMNPEKDIHAFALILWSSCRE
jgi:hypothetical protein